MKAQLCHFPRIRNIVTWLLQCSATGSSCICFICSRSKCLASSSRSSYILEAAFKHTQAYLFNLELSTAIQLLSIAFSHYFIHNLATGPVSSPFYTLLDRDNFHLLSRTRLWSSGLHMASLTASQSQKGWSSQFCHCSRS